ncbi:slipin family protein [Streptomyces sp. AV19]|uniref:slipin family protein n=1 Tax=Streptomyces sp. AV19 TaxID=2793068 RepID=UPI002412FEBE|nr:slipin family protein [Streptomyces sp. AV19]MDG4536646.1 slipin family protein [Streptomyces sp. AV19]
MPEYERRVIFRLGRITGAKGPGLFFIIPVVDRMTRVSLRTVTMDSPPQDVMAKDNVTVRVSAVTYFNVVDPNRSVLAIEDHIKGTSQIAQTTLRSILGQVDLDELLVNRDEINQRLHRIIDDVTNPWGFKITLAEVKDVELPEPMRRAMARQAGTERDRRAKVIHAKGEFEAAETLADAADRLEGHPVAVHLRILSTMTEISSERNSTLIFPCPWRSSASSACCAPPGHPVRRDPPRGGPTEPSPSAPRLSVRPGVRASGRPRAAQHRGHRRRVRRRRGRCDTTR